MKKEKTVFVALSGGVDSAVAAAKLLAQGYQVTGIHMETWKDHSAQRENSHKLDTKNLAKQTADFLGIPFISLDVRLQFYDQVVQTFINDYLEGKTPNPCLFCNPHIKWGILQSYAFNQGADFFASGHYARIEYLGSGQVHLLRGKDPNKDQSYVLSMLTQSQLGRSLFPIGDMLKGEVRSLAHRLGLTFIDREESQDLCFLGNVDYRDFLIRYAPQAANLGEIVNERGEVLGEHNGLAFYTIGQRKGIRIAASQPYFVIGKDREKNHLVVGFAEQTERSNLIAIKPNWIAGKPPDEGKNYSVMIRYRAKPVNAALFYISSDEFRLEFNDGVRGITPGQAAVLYQGEVCLGGGIIHASR